MASKVVQKRAGETVEVHLDFANAMLAAQAVTLDNMFTEFAGRTGANMGQYPHGTERYARLAMKAQSNVRALLEALAKPHLLHEQTVLQVHVS